MGSLSRQAIAEICEAEKEQLGDEYVDLGPTLDRALTVGDLKKALAGLDDALPVAIEVMVDHDAESWLSESGFVVQAFETEPSMTGTSRFLLNAVRPEHLDAFMAEFDRN